MADMRRVTYCGLYCGLCANSNRVPRQAEELRDTLRRESVEFWGPTLPYFDEFWRFLGNLAESESRRSCRERTCGNPSCEIRKCALEKGVDVCPFCDEYPCERVMALAEVYPTLLADGKRVKKIGLDKWIDEQEQRKGTGFAYADIRCSDDGFPEK